MIKVGITGQSGFVGTHLYNTLGDFPQKYVRIPFEDYFFEEDKKLRSFVKQCDVIVHLAAMMRSPIEGQVYETNMRLVNQIIDAADKEGVAPSIMFASSIQENNGSEYGNCKRDGRILLTEWAERHNVSFGGMVFPNLFGPLARPNSHSFIATFCYKLTHGEKPEVLVDNVVSLKYIKNLISELISLLDYIVNNKVVITKTFEPDYLLKVTEVLSILENFMMKDVKYSNLLEVSSQEEKDLLETYISYKDYVI